MTQRELLPEPDISQSDGIDVDQELRLFLRDLGVWRCHQRLKERREDLQSLALLDKGQAGRAQLVAGRRGRKL